MSDVEVRDNPAEHRYEAWLDGQLAGMAVYRLRPGLIVFEHTEVGDEFEGKGVGSTLARGALDAVRADGSRAVLPLCPFIKGWIEKHPDYQTWCAPPADFVHRRVHSPGPGCGLVGGVVHTPSTDFLARVRDCASGL